MNLFKGLLVSTTHMSQVTRLIEANKPRLEAELNKLPSDFVKRAGPRVTHYKRNPAKVKELEKKFPTNFSQVMIAALEDYLVKSC